MANTYENVIEEFNKKGCKLLVSNEELKNKLLNLLA